MASGCILGECPVCNELVWEDSWDLVDGKELIFVHPECKLEANGIKLQIKRLEERVHQLESKLKEARE